VCSVQPRCVLAVIGFDCGGSLLYLADNVQHVVPLAVNGQG